MFSLSRLNRQTSTITHPPPNNHPLLPHWLRRHVWLNRMVSMWERLSGQQVLLFTSEQQQKRNAIWDTHTKPAPPTIRWCRWCVEYCTILQYCTVLNTFDAFFRGGSGWLVGVFVCICNVTWFIIVCTRYGRLVGFGHATHPNTQTFKPSQHTPAKKGNKVCFGFGCVNKDLCYYL